MTSAFNSSDVVVESEIAGYIESHGYSDEGVPSWTIQFVCRDYELKDGWLAFRFARVLEL